MEHNFPNMFLVIVEPSWCKYWGILYLATYSQHHLQCVCHMNVPRFPSATRLIVCRHFPRKRHLRWMICLEGERCWFQTCRASVFGVSSVFQQNLDKYVWHSRWKVTASVSLRKGTVNEETLGCSQIHCTKWFQKKQKNQNICAFATWFKTIHNFELLSFRWKLLHDVRPCPSKIRTKNRNFSQESPSH